jgi:hypothetical protein
MRIERQPPSRLAALAVSAVFIFSGCARWGHRRPGAAAIEPPPGPRRVGTVAVVNEELRFVLVDVGSLYVPQAGTALKSFSGDTESGILAVDPEKRRPFIVADIIKGEPKVGDEVRE